VGASSARRGPDGYRSAARSHVGGVLLWAPAAQAHAAPMLKAKPRVPKPRKGQGDVALSREEFARRLGERFHDPAFRRSQRSIERMIEIAWRTYDEYHKSPIKRRAGSDFSHPDFELPVEWLDARDAIISAQQRHAAQDGPYRILLVSGAARHDQTCPGEMSKTFRLATMAREVFQSADNVECDLLDLSLLTAQYGRQILPCKACVSTAMPLCHWPCSCYPNHALGQVNDWMNEIYPRWVAAHGILIVTPVYWYQAPSVLKLMMDRLVCADGGNPDPTTTAGKDPAKAKALELKGWRYPRHLAGRRFAIVVHGDAAGTEVLRRSLTDWLHDMQLRSAGYRATIDRYIGYYEPYATSHEALDRDVALQDEVRNAARTLVDAVVADRRDRRPPPGSELDDPRPK
jgi:multimeric flavodoxin WrbA